MTPAEIFSIATTIASLGFGLMNFIVNLQIRAGQLALKDELKEWADRRFVTREQSQREHDLVLRSQTR